VNPGCPKSDVRFPMSALRERASSLEPRLRFLYTPISYLLSPYSSLSWHDQPGLQVGRTATGREQRESPPRKIRGTRDTIPSHVADDPVELQSRSWSAAAGRLIGGTATGGDLLIKRESHSATRLHIGQPCPERILLVINK